MIWIACASSWLATAAAVIYAISVTGRIAPLWFLLIPTILSYSERGGKEKEDSPNERSETVFAEKGKNI
jgi:hypothetical protein